MSLDSVHALLMSMMMHIYVDQAHGEGCTSGWNRIADSCFFISSYKRTWPQAVGECQNYDARLAELDHERLNVDIMRLLVRRQQKKFWIGLVLGDLYSVYWSWYDGYMPRVKLKEEPSISLPPCGAMDVSSGEPHWRQVECLQPLCFVCQKPANDPSNSLKIPLQNLLKIANVKCSESSKPTGQNGDYSCEKAYDDNTQADFALSGCSCTYPQPRAWWKVQLPVEYLIYYLKVIPMLWFELRDYDVFVGRQLCIRMSGKTLGPRHTTLSCDKLLVGKEVTIQLRVRDVVAICDLEIWGRDAARSMITNDLVSFCKQISSIFKGNCNQAYNGVADGLWKSGGCTHTSRANAPWWSIQLKKAIYVSTVGLMNRRDCCAERLRQFNIFVDDYLCAHQKNPAYSTTTQMFPCQQELVGSNIKVQLQLNDYLSICNIIIMGKHTVNSRTDAQTRDLVRTESVTCSMKDQSQQEVCSQPYDSARLEEHGGCLVTKKMQNPRWTVHFKDWFLVGEVRIRGRRTCCFDGLSKFDVLVDTWLCTHREAPVGRLNSSAMAFLSCGKELPGRSVAIQMQEFNSLGICDIAVIGRPAKCGPKGDICKNGATCSATNATFKCLCAPGWRSALCDEDVDECREDPCGKEAISCENTLGSFQCKCKSGFEGKVCKQNVDECDRKTHECRNGGECIDTSGSYRCKCQLGWSGEHCTQQIDVCERYKPCQNDANCSNQPGTYECDCGHGWKGKNCSSDVDECSENMPCRNQAVCTNTGGSYECRCTQGFTGFNCDKACKHIADVLVMVDASGSISDGEWKYMKNFLLGMIDHFVSVPDDVQLAVIAFSQHAKVLCSLTARAKLASCRSSIEKYEQEQQSTDLPAALALAGDEVFTDRGGDRPSAPNLVILVSDAKSDGYAGSLVQAEKLKTEKDADIITVGYGGEELESSLQKIATKPSYHFHISKLAQLGKQVDRIFSWTCLSGGRTAGGSRKR